MLLHAVNRMAVAIALASLATGALADDNASREKGAGPLRHALMPDYPDVVGEYVQIPGARQADDIHVIATPEEFNTATFLRVRSALDGVKPRKANAVILAMPGFSSTPGNWMYLASQLVHKANRKKNACKDGDKIVDCRLEVWIVQRRGAHLADTLGARRAIVQDEPLAAVAYYFGESIMGSDGRTALDGRGKFPVAGPKLLTGRPDATWRPLEQGDLGFIADWGVETFAGDVDSMLALIGQEADTKNVFLAGHSQGGSFTSVYAGRLRPDRTRGYQHLAGIVMLDDAGAYGTPGLPSEAQRTAHRAAIDALRDGSRPVYTDATGLNLASGPAAGARELASTRYYARENPRAESLFAPRQTGMITASAGFPGTTAASANAFLGHIRLSHLARAGMNFDTSPTSAASLPLQVNLQEPLVIAVGESLGLLNFEPVPATEHHCDSSSPPDRCVPLLSQIDEEKIYGWTEAGGGSVIPPAQKVGVGKAAQFMKGYAWTSNRTNIRPVTYRFPVSGTVSIDAREIVTSNWYPSERYELEMKLVSAGPTFTFDYKGVNLDIDKSLIDIPLYYANQRPVSSTVPSVFPLVTDYTNIGATGTVQSPAAAAKSPISASINTRYYKHTDFVAADDSLGERAFAPAPGMPGSSLVANTLVDWVLARTGGKAARVPTPRELGVALSR
jgi:pimeloyl-ACP methyl ester carboxylesterase